jgi:hypothetical protein
VIEAARPAFVWAGALLAAVPFLLHLLRPRERKRRPLPTLRFVSPDDRRRVHVQRSPDELLLLTIRMGVCLLLGASLAGLTWVGPASGTGSVVVVDGGAGMAPVWAAARMHIGAGAPAADGVAFPTEPPGGTSAGQRRLVSLVVVKAGADGEPQVERYDPDALPDEEAWARLAPDPSTGEVRLAHLIRALRDEAGRTTGADSLVGRIITVPRWSTWGPGVVELREALWPASIELNVPEPTAGASVAMASQPPDAFPVSVTLQSPTSLRGPLEEALQALGLTLIDGTLGAEPTVSLRVGPEDTLGELWNPTLSPAPHPPDPDAGDAFLLVDGRVLPGAGPSPTGTPADGTTVPLLRVGGRPAAAAAILGTRCEIALPLDERSGILVRGELLLLLEALLLTACELDGRDGAEVAWRNLLTSREGPAALEARPLRRAGVGWPLTRLLLTLTMGVAFLEVLRARRVEANRVPSATATAAGFQEPDPTAGGATGRTRGSATGTDRTEGRRE